MGWRGTLRSIGAAQRRAERSAVRRHRELQRRLADHAKMLEREAAAYEVDVYQNRIERLRSVHKDCGDPVDWKSLLDARKPFRPAATTARTEAAERVLAAYRPGLVDRVLRQADARRASLGRVVESAREADAEESAVALARYEREHADWRDTRDLAARVLGGDPVAFRDVIQEMNPFAEIDSIGSSVEFRFVEGGSCELAVHVHADDVIPNEALSLTKSGKLSVKKIARGQFNELYQDYVCGCAIRVAREVFALVPVQSVIVTALGELLDSATGHIAERPILSVLVPRSTLGRINFETVDPSDALKNFVHRMNFGKTRGFVAVERIASGDLQA